MDKDFWGQLLEWLDEGKSVSVRNNGSRWWSLQEVQPLIERIEQCEDLKLLQLEGNSLKLEAATHLANALKSKRELNYALFGDLLSGMKNDDLGKDLPIYLLCEGIKVAGASLTRFDVSNNSLGEHGLVLISPFLESPSCAGLQHLILTSTGLGPEGTRKLCSALIRCIERSREFGGRAFGLKILKIGSNSIKDDGAYELANLLKEMTTLEEIHLQSNSIESDGMAALATGFDANPHLQVINLGDNFLFWDRGVLEMSNVFGRLQQLRILDLANCQLGVKGCLKIVKALEKTGKVTKLNLSGNYLGKEGGRKVCSALHTLKRSLKEVKLYHNGIGNEERCQIVDKLRPVFCKIDMDEEEQEFEELTEMQSFLEDPSETTFLLLTTTQPTFLVVGYLRNLILQHGGHFGKKCLHLAFKVISRLSFDDVSERMADFATYLFSEAANSTDWSPNEMVSYLMVKTSVFTPEDGATLRGIIRMSPIILYCLDKWITERPVPREVTFYLSVISQHTMRSRSELLDLPMEVIDTFQAAMDAAYDYALQKNSQVTIPVALR